MAAFVREVAIFKDTVARGIKPPVSEANEPSFTPEFAGKPRAYTVSARIQSSCSHGFVVNELKAELERRGFKGIGKDRPRDLDVEPTKGRMEFLFEAKSRLATDSIYKGIGQLAYHSAKDERDTKRVFVCLVRRKLRHEPFSPSLESGF